MTELHRTLYCGGGKCWASPFTLFQGQHVWAGPSSEYVESSSGGIAFQASIAQCTPHYQDWGTVGLLNVTGSAIVPGSIYNVEQLASTCEGRETDPACLPGGSDVSQQLPTRTTRWSDVEIPYNPPSPTIQPDITDVSSLVDKFRNAPGALNKARGILAGIPGNPWGEVNAEALSADFGFSHISAGVDAYRGVPYPYLMGKCAGAPTSPATGACRSNAECTGNNGAGPCMLYCP